MEGKSEGERALAELESALADIDDGALTRPHADPQAGAVTALLVADYLRQPELGERLASLGVSAELGAQLARFARAILWLVERLDGDYLPDSRGVPGDLVQRGIAVRSKVLAELEKIIHGDSEVAQWIEAIRAGSGVVDLVYDLRSLAELSSHHASDLPEATKAAAAARSAVDALEFALRAGEHADQAKHRKTLAKIWTLFVPAYEKAAAAGRELTRADGRERKFPPLTLIASYRRARRKPVSLVPPARPSTPSVHPSSAKVPAAAAVPEGLEKVEVLRSEPPPPPPAPTSAPDLGERQSWTESRRSHRQIVEIEVGLASESNFYVGFTENLSEAGVFIATYAAKPIGAKVIVALAFPNGDELRVPGTVRWQREAASDGWPGMGVQFDKLSADDEAKIRKFLSLREPMFYDA